MEQARGGVGLAGGDLQGPGSATVGPAGTVALDGSCFSELTDGYALANAGTMRVPQGHELFLSGDGTRLDNAGRLELGNPAMPGCAAASLRTCRTTAPSSERGRRRAGRRAEEKG